MKLFDTNVFLYAAGRSHPYKEPCVQLVSQASARIGEYAIDAELLQEVLYVYGSRGERARGLVVFDELIVAFPDPFPIGRAELAEARILMEQYPALSPRDAIHAAVVVTRSMEGIITTDQAFRGVRGLTVFDPAELAAGG